MSVIATLHFWVLEVQYFNGILLLLLENISNVRGLAVW